MKCQRLKLHIPELKVIVNKIKHGGIIGSIENRSSKLNLDCSPEFICRQLVVEVNENITVDSFSVAINVVCPHCAVHKFVNIALHSLKDLTVRSLYLLSRNLHIAI